MSTAVQKLLNFVDEDSVMEWKVSEDTAHSTFRTVLTRNLVLTANGPREAALVGRGMHRFDGRRLSSDVALRCARSGTSD